MSLLAEPIFSPLLSAMAPFQSPIYRYVNGKYDDSRWLTISPSQGGMVRLHLQDLTRDRHGNSLHSVRFEASMLKALLKGNSLQISSPEAFLLLVPVGNEVHLEFRGPTESAAIRATILRQDLTQRICEILGVEPHQA